MRSLALFSCLCGLALLSWAFLSPLLGRREASRLLAEARQTLSPPLAGLENVDDINCDEAAQRLRRALELVPSNGEARRELQLAEGCSALRRGDLILAEGGLRAAARQLPVDHRPERWLGSLELANDNPEEALRHYRRALELDAGDVSAQLGLSDALAELERPEEALSALDAIPAEEAGGLLETRRGMLYEALERWDEARAAYRRAIELAPGAAAPRNNLAALERDAGNLEEAWSLQNQALERAQDDPVILLNTGLLAITLGHDQRAIELLRRAGELDQTTADPARALADHLLVLGRSDEALEALGPALGHFPRDAALRNTLGNAFAAVGRRDEARAAYRTAIELDAELAEPHNGLAALHLGEGDLSAAELELERALRLDPGNAQARRNLAELLRRQGEPGLEGQEQRLAQAPSR